MIFSLVSLLANHSFIGLILNYGLIKAGSSGLRWHFASLLALHWSHYEVHWLICYRKM